VSCYLKVSCRHSTVTYKEKLYGKYISVENRGYGNATNCTSVACTLLTHGTDGQKCDVAASYYFFFLLPLERKIQYGSCESDETRTGQPDGAAEW